MRLSKDAQDVVNQVESILEDKERTIQDLENANLTLHNKLEEKDIEVDRLMSDIEELTSYIKDLETALAEAHLMSVDDKDIQ